MAQRFQQLVVAVAVAALAGSCGGGHRDERPNIVLIIIDTLRADRLGCYGFPLPTSPEIDRYANRGVRFERVLAQATWTRPSIGSALTSAPARTLGLYDEGEQILPPWFDTLAEVLDRRGYVTLGATANPHINSHYDFQQGFDHYLDSDVVFDFMEPDQGGTVRGRDRPLPATSELFDDLLREVERRPAGPYYLQVDLMEVHEFRHWEPPPDGPWADLDPEGTDELELRYLRAIRYLSAEIDRFIRVLSRRWQGQRTLWVLTSDHGETLGDQPELRKPKTHGYLVYPSQADVPLIWYETGGDLPSGRVVEAPVSLLDLAPSLAAYAGATVPEAWQGRDLATMVRGEEGSRVSPPSFVVETRFRRANKIALYRDGWIYVENRAPHPGTAPVELHPPGVWPDGRATSVAARHRKRVRALRRELAEWESAHPAMQPMDSTEEPPEELVRQLRALGYLQDDSP